MAFGDLTGMFGLQRWEVGASHLRCNLELSFIMLPTGP